MEVERMAFRFVHAADLHLDSPFRGMSPLPEAIRERVRESTFRALDSLVELAVRERADFVVVSGDVYDAADRSLRAQLRFQAALRRLAESGVRVFAVHGNHDPADGREARLDRPALAVTFGTERVETVAVELPGRGVVAEVHGISFDKPAVTDNLALRFRRRTPGVFQIGVLHANVDGEEGHDNYAPCSVQDLKSAGIDYWALGHIHARRILHERPWVVYPGNTQGRSVRETGSRGCYIVDVNDVGEVNAAFHALDDVRWFVECVDLASTGTEQELIDELERTVDRVRLEADGRAAVARLVLEGRSPLHADLHSGRTAEELASALRERELERAEGGGDDWVWVESIENRTLPDADVGLLAAQPGFLGELLKQADDILQSEAELERFAEDAAAPLLEGIGRHLGKGWLQECRGELLRRAQIRIVDALAGEGGEPG
jgi:DNA repair exonuclease SbcCD nuclease subunit